MTAQQQVLSDTRMTLSGVQATQVAIKEENGRLAGTIKEENSRLAEAIRELAKEVRRKNGNSP